MGRLLGLLLMLNVAVLVTGLGFEWVRGKPSRLVDFNADRVRLVTANAPASTGAAEVLPDPLAEVSQLPAAEPPSQPAEPTQPAAPAPAPVAAASRCLDWDSYDAATHVRLEERLTKAGIAPGAYTLELDKALGWWVYLPPLKDPDAARAALEEIRRMGVKDLALVRSGVMVNAISLGAFANLDKARIHARRMGAMGLDGVRMGPRPNVGGARLILAESVPEKSLAGLAQGWSVAPHACPEAKP